MAPVNGSRCLIAVNRIPPPSTLPAADTIPTRVPILLQNPFRDHLLRTNPAQQDPFLLRIAADIDTIASNNRGNSTRMTNKDRAKAAGAEGSNAAMLYRVLPKRHRRKICLRVSKYRGVSRYTGGFGAYLWDNSDPTKKPKSVCIGAFDDEEMAAIAHDLIALKFWGESTILNFPVESYQNDIEEMKTMSKHEYFMEIRRASKGFAKGTSQYRGVFRKPLAANPNVIRWQARLGGAKNYKGIHLGTFDTESLAARAYDVAVIRLRGPDAQTNFCLRQYNVAHILQRQRLNLGKGTSWQFKSFTVDEILQRMRTDANQTVPDKDSRMPRLLQQQLPMPARAAAAAAVQFQNPVPPPQPITAAAPLTMTGGGSSANLNRTSKACKVEPMEEVGVNSAPAVITAGIGNARFGGSQVTSFRFPPQSGGIQTPMYVRGFAINNGELQPPIQLVQQFAGPPYHVDLTTSRIPGDTFSPNNRSPYAVAAGNQRVPNSGPFAANGQGWLSL